MKPFTRRLYDGKVELRYTDHSYRVACVHDGAAGISRVVPSVGRVLYGFDKTECLVYWALQCAAHGLRRDLLPGFRHLSAHLIDYLRRGLTDSYDDITCVRARNRWSHDLLELRYGANHWYRDVIRAHDCVDGVSRAVPSRSRIQHGLSQDLMRWALQCAAAGLGRELKPGFRCLSAHRIADLRRGLTVSYEAARERAMDAASHDWVELRPGWRQAGALGNLPSRQTCIHTH